jgi:hypothetical protein
MADVISIIMKDDGARRYAEVARRLRKAGRGDLQRRMVRSIRREGGPALNSVRQAWLTVEVTSLAPNDRGGHGRPDRSTGLRRRVSRATRIAVQQRGIKIYVSGKAVDPNYPSLPFYLNGFPRRRPWRHQVFGNRNVWVAQRGQEVFYPAAAGHARAWRRGIEGEMKSTVEEISRGI